ncbi:hypothetical protein F4Z99_13985 [Candidatus Poribacteria bacterium]|nr:hypothetical protein [Candidatus Poribacteria bacterium]
MAIYYVNKNSQSDGVHEVHKGNCNYLPHPENRFYLGDFTSCHIAIIEALKYFSSVDGCYWCSRECHTR